MGNRLSRAQIPQTGAPDQHINIPQAQDLLQPQNDAQTISTVNLVSLSSGTPLNIQNSVPELSEQISSPESEEAEQNMERQNLHTALAQQTPELQNLLSDLRQQSSVPELSGQNNNSELADDSQNSANDLNEQDSTPDLVKQNSDTDIIELVSPRQSNSNLDDQNSDTDLSSPQNSTLDLHQGNSVDDFGDQNSQSFNYELNLQISDSEPNLSNQNVETSPQINTTERARASITTPSDLSIPEPGLIAPSSDTPNFGGNPTMHQIPDNIAAGNGAMNEIDPFSTGTGSAAENNNFQPAYLSTSPAIASDIGESSESKRKNESENGPEDFEAKRLALEEEEEENDVEMIEVD